MNRFKNTSIVHSSDLGEYTTEVPTIPELRACIALYFFHDLTNEEQPIELTFYPHYLNAISIYRKADLTELDGDRIVISPSKREYVVRYGIVNRHPTSVLLTPPVERIGIVFEPLGINHYLFNDFHTFIYGGGGLNPSFTNGVFKQCLDEVFAEQNVQKRAAILDDFFEEAFLGFDDETMKNMVEYVLDSEYNLSIEELSEEFAINRRTIHRMFLKHFNSSPKEYLQMLRFRKAIQLYESEAGNPTLSALGYDAGYYDQSAFIKHFVKITGVNPKSFFDGMSKQTSEGMNRHIRL